MFNKVKQALGFVGIDVILEVPTDIPKASSLVEGKVRIVAKADQSITRVVVKLIEHWERGEKGKDYQSKYLDLGEVDIREPFDIKAGETREFPFRLLFERPLSMTQQVAEKKGALGTLGKVAAFADQQRSSYRISAMVDVKGAALDPNASQNIRFV